MLRKCRPNGVPAATIELASQEKEGQAYNWCLYLLNQFMEDCIETQEYNQPFHYNWLLVLMAFVMWKEPKHSQFLMVRGDYRWVRYENLWATTNMEKQRINNMVFYTYY